MMKFGDVLEELNKDHSKVFISESKTKIYINNKGQLEFDNGVHRSKPILPGNWFKGGWKLVEDDWCLAKCFSIHDDYRALGDFSELKKKILEGVRESFATTPGAEFQGPVENKIKEVINKRFGFRRN